MQDNRFEPGRSVGPSGRRRLPALLAGLGLASVLAGALPGLWSSPEPSAAKTSVAAGTVPLTLVASLPVSADADGASPGGKAVGTPASRSPIPLVPSSDHREASAGAEPGDPSGVPSVPVPVEHRGAAPRPDAMPETTPASAPEHASRPSPSAPVESGGGPQVAAAPVTTPVLKASKAPERVLDVEVRKGDSLSAIFKRLDLEMKDMYAFLHAGEEAGALNRLRPGQQLRFSLDAAGRLVELEYRVDLTDSLRIVREPDQGKFRVEARKRNLDARVRFAGAVIENSLFGAGQAAGVSDAVTMRIAEIFGWDIDFALDIRRGDRFSVLYEENYLDGEKVRDGDVLAVEFENRGRTYRAVRYTNAGGESGYFTPKGKSLRKAFLRTPVKFSRISSRFSTGRYHPVLHRIRAHKGVDYAAPTGTPVRATGNGKVAFKGRKGGYGRVVMLRHGNRYTTLYAHLSRYAAKLRKGQWVEQGQTIGYVGSSGLASGPHLHYEFRIDNRHVDPLKVKFPAAEPIPAGEREAFGAHVASLRARMERERTTTIALNEVP